MATALSCYALALFEVQRNEEAESAFEEAIQFTVDKGLPGNRVMVILNRGQLRHALGQYEDAYADFAEALHQAETRRMAVMRVMSGYYRSMLDMDLGRTEPAIKSLTEGIEDFFRMGERRGVAMHAEALALLSLSRSYTLEAAMLLGFSQGLRDAIPAQRCPAHEAWFRRQLERSGNEGILDDSVDIQAGRILEFSSGVDLARRVGQALGGALGVDCCTK